LPNTTGNFELYGEFFKDSMCLTANLATSIIFVGQTVNYAVFHSSSWITVNVTTGATEGLFAITLDNGLSKTFANAYMVVLGTVYEPLSTDWTGVSLADVSKGSEVNIVTYGANHNATWNKEFNYLINFSFRFSCKKSPLGAGGAEYNTARIKLIKVSNSAVVFAGGINYNNSNFGATGANILGGVTPIFFNSGNSHSTIEYRYIAGVSYLYIDNVLKGTFSNVLTENVKLQLNLQLSDITNIKYIELA